MIAGIFLKQKTHPERDGFFAFGPGFSEGYLSGESMTLQLLCQEVK